MKKWLMIIAVMISLSSFAAPWDIKVSKMSVKKWTQPFKAAFTDPFFVEREIEEAYVTGQRKLHVHVKFDQSLPYAMLYIFGQYGYWEAENDWMERNYEITYPPGTLEKHTYFPLTTNDDPTWGWFNEYYLGPVS